MKSHNLSYHTFLGQNRHIWSFVAPLYLKQELRYDMRGCVIFTPPIASKMAFLGQNRHIWSFVAPLNLKRELRYNMRGCMKFYPFPCLKNGLFRSKQAYLVFCCTSVSQTGAEIPPEPPLTPSPSFTPLPPQKWIHQAKLHPFCLLLHHFISIGS